MNHEHHHEPHRSEFMRSTHVTSLPLLVAADEAARMLGVGRSTLWALVKRKAAPPPVKIGGLTRWRVADLQQHVQAIPPTSS